ncbi:MAG: type ISP restriction/modification enzyme [Methylococcales bacterium]|nr:type ISP restriction/modification enzyme [Methylococcales bacterium]
MIIVIIYSYLFWCNKSYEANRLNPEINNTDIKWSRAVKNDLKKGTKYQFDSSLIVDVLYRPFVKRKLYFSKQLNEMQYQLASVFTVQDNCENTVMSLTFHEQLQYPSIQVSKSLWDYGYGARDSTGLPLYIYTKDGSRHDNITDWALKQFQAHYENPALVPTRGVGMPSHRAAVQDAARLQLHSHAARGNEINTARGNEINQFQTHDEDSKLKPRFELQTEDSESKPWFVSLNKTDIFNYVYAVLHDPRYREKFALNLKAEFPRIPFHPDFAAWAAIGAKLIKLHAEFEHVEPWEFERVESSVRPEPVEGLESFMLQGASTKKTAKTKLKADKIKHCIEIDSQTTLANIPPEAWQYQLGNRSALEWVLDQYKEKTPKDPTIREKFNTYRFADHKEHVIELLAKVCRVSVETMALIEEIQALTWD